MAATTRTRLISHPSLREVLEELASFSSDEFDSLWKETNTYSAFDSSEDRCQRFANKLPGRDPVLFGYLFSLLDFLYKEATKKAKDEARLNELLAELVKSLDLGDGSEADSKRTTLQQRLLKLLTHNENAERRDKIVRLKQGFLDNATGFSSFVDLRPNIDSGRTRVDDYVPVVQLRISTDSKSEAGKHLVVQLDEEALDKLKLLVEDTQRKLSVLRADAAVAGKLTRY